MSTDLLFNHHEAPAGQWCRYSGQYAEGAGTTRCPDDCPTSRIVVTPGTLTTDHAHVVLDALTLLISDIKVTEPWLGYTGDDTDPKLTPAGYRKLVDEAHAYTTRVVASPCRETNNDHPFPADVADSW